MYHDSAQLVAVPRVDEDFSALLARACWRMGRSASGLTLSQRQLLKDAARSEVRYGFKALRALLEIGAHCHDASDATAVPELLRGYVLALRARVGCAAFVGVFDSFRLETEAQYAADLAQLAHLASRSKATRDGAIETLAAHESAIRTSLDALWAELAQEGRKSLSLMR